MIAWIKRIIRAILGLPRRKDLRVVFAEEAPSEPKPGVVYVLGEGRHLWFVVLLCPCGCRAKLELSLLPEADPNWVLVQHGDGTISLQPSVWRRVGCRSHFFIHRSRIEWCHGGAAVRLPGCMRETHPQSHADGR